MAMTIVALGLFLLLFKIGHPERLLYVLRQPWRSWMSREAWVAGLFFPLAAMATWFGSPALTIAAAVTAFLFLFSQAMILKEAKGIPSWRVRAVVPLIVSTGLAEGAGLFLAATTVFPALKSVSEHTAITVVLLAAVRSWTWQSYRSTLGIEGAPILALAELDRYRLFFFVVGLALPALLVAAGFVGAPIEPFVFVVAGACVAVAGGALKFILITRAGFNQGFALKHTPVRGAGVPGPAVKPGWVRA
jgi:phenylacetyl-CoA:acceptor oxidoreductase subunit 2